MAGACDQGAGQGAAELAVLKAEEDEADSATLVLAICGCFYMAGLRLGG